MHAPRVLIPLVEDGLEKILRDGLPLPPDIGDISFDPPASTWSAQLSRLTVNLFLYEVSRSAQPSGGPMRRRTDSGAVERRPPLPMIDLTYLVSAWAGSPRDEHQLLSDVLYVFLNNTTIDPVEGGALESRVQLAIIDDERNQPRELWSTLGGNAKASFAITATVAAEAFDWAPAARVVTSISAIASRMEAAPPPGAGQGRGGDQTPENP